MDTFYRDTYYVLIEAFLRYQFQDDNVSVSLIKRHYCHMIVYETKAFMASISLWHNYIIEEQIIDKDKSQSIFYLHYHFHNLAQFKAFFDQFVTFYKRHITFKKDYVGIISGGGITSELFVQLLREAQKYEDNQTEIEALSAHGLDHLDRYKLLYLAPQLAEKLPMFLSLPIPVYLIDPIVYGTGDSLSMLQRIKSDLKKQDP